MATAFLFPGQGAQTADAASLIHEHASDLLETCIAALGEDPLPRCDESTRFAQPAIVLASLAGWRAEPDHDAAAFAGHSLGELSALAAAVALDEHDAVRLAVLRGALMDDAAAKSGDGGMLAILGGTREQAAGLAGAHGLTVANDNAPGQIVLAGPAAVIEGARRAARDEGLSALELDVAGAFHSPAMAAAVEPFAAALADVEFAPPAALVVSGLTASPFEDFAAELAAAIIAPVRWREVMLALAARGIDSFVDVGPGRVLDRLVARNLEEAADAAGVRV
jgi:malonyl CoA-acyl carrier protein transacylase